MCNPWTIARGSWIGLIYLHSDALKCTLLTPPARVIKRLKRRRRQDGVLRPFVDSAGARARLWMESSRDRTTRPPRHALARTAIRQIKGMKNARGRDMRIIPQRPVFLSPTHAPLPRSLCPGRLRTTTRVTPPPLNGEPIVPATGPTKTRVRGIKRRMLGQDF